MEDNKLIAEFMGYKNPSNAPDIWYHYDTSWDWLMPVVEKIEQIHEGVPKQLIHVSLFSTRQEVYQAVVEFIKQHNK